MSTGAETPFILQLKEKYLVVVLICAAATWLATLALLSAHSRIFGQWLGRRPHFNLQLKQHIIHAQGSNFFVGVKFNDKIWMNGGTHSRLMCVNVRLVKPVKHE